MTNYLDLLPVASAAVDLAAGYLRTHRPGTLTAKGERDMATDVDFAIERQVRALLADRTPQIGFLGEEEGRSGPAGDLWWTLDPIDGTANFVHGSPLCGVALGLVSGNRPVLGIIDLPFLGDRYSAVEGNGALANGESIRVSAPGSLLEAMVGISDFGVEAGEDQRNRMRSAVISRLSSEAQRVRIHGSSVVHLAWLAQGRLDAIIIFSNKPWDTAAGVVIAREAGAEVVDFDGADHTVDSAATVGVTPKLRAQMVRLIREATSG
ncbi:MAG: inositol monophosphatase family protein [Micromonosporaceae bacterium]|nr:inositol monophosphatase family protein [Micromonosporaceae bacterium]